MNKMPTFYWSRVPGKFVNKITGESAPDIKKQYDIPRFSGTVREWYETLVETCHSLHIETNRKANAIIVSPDVLHLLVQSCVFKSCFNDEQNFILAKVGYLPSMGLSVYQDGNDEFVHLVHIDEKNTDIEEIAQLKILDLHFI